MLVRNGLVTRGDAVEMMHVGVDLVWGRVCREEERKTPGWGRMWEHFSFLHPHMPNTKNAAEEVKPTPGKVRTLLRNLHQDNESTEKRKKKICALVLKQLAVRVGNHGGPNFDTHFILVFTFKNAPRPRLYPEVFQPDRIWFRNKQK